MIDPEKVQEVRRSIARIAHSEEGVQGILHILQKTDWTNFFVYETPFARCFRCNCILTPLIDSGDELCLACNAFICALCKRPALKDDYHGYRYRVVCDACFIKRNISNENWYRLEANRISGHEIRAWKSGQMGDLSLRQWLTTLEDFNWRCVYCTTSPYEVIEHFIPISRGGDTIPSNCVPACRACNRTKSYKHPNELTDIPKEELTRIKNYLSTRL